MIARGLRTTVVLPAPLRDAWLRSLTANLSVEERSAIAAEEAARAAEEASRRAAVELQIKEKAAREERARLEPLLAALKTVNIQLRDRVASLEVDAKPQIVELAKAIATEITRREVEEGRYNLADVVQECFTIARGVDKGAVIYLHPSDYETALSGGELRTFEKDNITIKADAGLTRGGCRVATAYGDVVRDLDAAIADVLAAVDGRR